jgi:hypothetical protein
MARSEELLGLIGKVLRADYEDTKRQPMPRRWIDLLRHLDEQERQRLNPLPSEPSRQSGGE